MWYEYDFKVGDDYGHYETEDKNEIVKKMVELLGDILNGEAKAKYCERRVMDFEQVCNILVTYPLHNEGILTAKFGNVPVEWGGGFDTNKIFNA